MRVITLEDHFATPMFQEMFPRGNVSGYSLAERGAYLGYDISAELLNLGDTRLAAMDASGIDVQVVSLTMPGCEGFAGETAIAMATDANDRLAEGDPSASRPPGRIRFAADLHSRYRSERIGTSR